MVPDRLLSHDFQDFSLTVGVESAEGSSSGSGVWRTRLAEPLEEADELAGSLRALRPGVDGAESLGWAGGTAVETLRELPRRRPFLSERARELGWAAGAVGV
jgi:hypothetical protein